MAEAWIRVAARFDVCTGKALSAPAEVDLPVFAVKVEGDDILVRLSDRVTG